MGMARKPEPVAVSAAQTARVKEAFLPFYRVRANFYPEHKVVEGEEEVIFEHQDPRQEVVFNLYLNRYQSHKLSSSEIRKYALERGMEPGYIEIQNVSYKGKQVPFKEEGQLLKVTLEKDLFTPGEQALKIAFKVKIPRGADRVGGNDKGIWLGNWLPTLSVDGRRYRPTEIGDPYVNFSSTYEVTFSVPEDYSLVLSNVNSVQEQAGRKVYHGRLERVRDLPVFLNYGYREAMTIEGKTEIHYYYTSSNNREREVLAAARKALAFYEKNVGEYPWKQLNIVENDMYLNGMEYSTLLLISKKAIENNLTRTVFHEVGHQWFYNIIGSDQYYAPFMDEGWVEFLTSHALDNKEPRFWPHLTGLDKDLSYFTSWRQYREAHYHNGRKWFESLCFILGEEKFKKFLREYYGEFKYDLVSREQFKHFITERINDQSVHRLLGYIDK